MLSKTITYQELLAKIAKAQKNENNSTISISCGENLYVRVIGKKRNVYWYLRNADRTFKQIAPFSQLSLEAARKIVQANKNVPLISLSDSEKSELTFITVANHWLESRKNLSVSAIMHYGIIINKHLVNFHNLKISEINVRSTRAILLNLQKSGCITWLMISLLCRVLDYAVDCEIIKSHNLKILRKSSEFNYKNLKRDVKPYESAPLSEITQLFENTKDELPLYNYYYILLALLCLRPGECYSLKFEFFDLKNKTLTIPIENMKVKHQEPFRIPLNKYIIAVLKCIQQFHDIFLIQSEFLFPTIKKTKQNRKVSINRHTCGARWTYHNKPIKLHGFRKTARTWMAENDIALEVAAKCLDHNIYSNVEQIYQQSDLFQRRSIAMEKWAKAFFEKLPDFYREKITKFFEE